MRTSRYTSKTLTHMFFVMSLMLFFISALSLMHAKHQNSQSPKQTIKHSTLASYLSVKKPGSFFSLDAEYRLSKVRFV